MDEQKYPTVQVHIVYQFPFKHFILFVFQDIMRTLTTTGAGMLYDLEREEILGDSFLKYATSVFLYFTKEEVADEGRLTTLRSM